MNCSNCLLTKLNCICPRVSAFFEANGHLISRQDTVNRDGQALSRRLKAGFLALAVASGLMSCAKPHDGAPGASASPCSIKATTNGVHITCPDGSSQDIYNGYRGATGDTGPRGAAGPMGFPGYQGPAGPQGAQGVNGVDGVAGTNGVDATPVTAIQFCPGYATTYPSVFAEEGLCIAGNIYAVYWDNHNSWLTLIPPGTYDSTSTSAACSFKVLANCQVEGL